MIKPRRIGTDMRLYADEPAKSCLAVSICWFAFPLTSGILTDVRMIHVRLCTLIYRDC
jgi:hypothetical protein